jgi:crotonobetainyl-CoA:carnitine CoA-transferase CaiB-like acyl-CoA transferase
MTAEGGPAAPPGPLAGLRVVDLTVARAGPTCVRQLADMGAEVVRVSPPGRGDLGGSDAHNLHRNKRSLLLDLKHPQGHAAFLKLVERADVLVENFRAPVKQRLRIDWETLSRMNPRLVYGSISGFGQDGPYADRAGVDQIAQGLGGLMSVTGPPGSGPWRVGIAVSDTAAGTLLTQGILAALLVRERTGVGQWVHTSLLEAMISFMDFQAARWLIDGEVPGQAGNDHPTIFPMGTYRTGDGWMNIAAALGWERFVVAIDAPELGTDERFATYEARVRHRDELRQELEKVLATRTTAEWTTRINAAGIPCGPVLSIDAVFADPQVRHLEMTRRVVHATDGPLDLLRHPVGFSRTPASVRTPPPLAGEHTRDVLAELGYDDAAIDALVASGVAAVRSDAPGWIPKGPPKR